MQTDPSEEIVLKGKVYFHPESFSDSPTDITDGVQVMYDLIMSSRDWGSGFWSVEDLRPVLALAEKLGFKQSEEMRKQLEAADRWIAFRKSLKDAELKLFGEVGSHRHYFGIDNNRDACVLPNCSIKKNSPVAKRNIEMWDMYENGTVPHDHFFEIEDGTHKSMRCQWPNCKVLEVNVRGQNRKDGKSDGETG